MSEGAPAEITKADVLAVLKNLPIVSEMMPASARGLSLFWKKVGVEIPQARGYTSPEMERWIARFLR